MKGKCENGQSGQSGTRTKKPCWFGNYECLFASNAMYSTSILNA